MTTAAWLILIAIAGVALACVLFAINPRQPRDDFEQQHLKKTPADDWEAEKLREKGLL